MGAHSPFRNESNLCRFQTRGSNIVEDRDKSGSLQKAERLTKWVRPAAQPTNWRIEHSDHRRARKFGEARCPQPSLRIRRLRKLLGLHTTGLGMDTSQKGPAEPWEFCRQSDTSLVDGCLSSSPITHESDISRFREVYTYFLDGLALPGLTRSLHLSLP